MSSESGEEDVLAGFLLGNIDENNKLEADYLDKEARHALGGLSKLHGADIGLGSLLSQEIGSTKAVLDEDTTVRPTEQAADFSQELELIEDPGALEHPQLAAVEAEEEDYDIPSEKEVPPLLQPAPSLPPQDLFARAKSLGISLPTITKDGEILLAFTDLFRPVVQKPPRKHIKKRPSAASSQPVPKQTATDDDILSASLQALRVAGVSVRDTRPSGGATKEQKLSEEIHVTESQPVPQPTEIEEIPPSHKQEPVVVEEKKGPKFPELPPIVFDSVMHDTWDVTKTKTPVAIDETRVRFEADGQAKGCWEYDGAPLELEDEETSHQKPELPTAPRLPARDYQMECAWIVEEDSDNGQMNRVEKLPMAPAARLFGEGSAAADWEVKLPMLLQNPAEAALYLEHAPMLFDLNDEACCLEQKDGWGDQLPSLTVRAKATILPPQASGGARAHQKKENAVLAELSKLKGLSKEKEYFGTTRRARAGQRTSVYHAKLAADLVTIPLILAPAEAARWHRPMGAWWPLMATKISLPKSSRGGAGAAVTLATLISGVERRFMGIDLTQVAPNTLWESATSKALDFKDAAGAGQPLFLVPGNPPSLLQPSAPLATMIPSDSSRLRIVAAFRTVELSKTDVVASLPDALNNVPPSQLRPPMAFSKKKELATASPGKVIVVEYMEENPILLGRPGMGARLVTYYKKKDVNDSGALALHNAAVEARGIGGEGALWSVGATIGLNPDDESPFLGKLKPGSSQMAVETGLATCPAAPYETPPTSFLLTRSSAGVMRVREITGSVAVGQQLPLHRIPAPGSRDLKDLEERRMYVYIFRTLRAELLRLERLGMNAPPTVSLKTLTTLFAGRPENMIKAYLREVAELEIVARDREGKEIYGLRPGARFPTDAELRKKISPEEACLIEALAAAEARLRARGLYRYTAYGPIMPEKLRLAAEMLRSDPEVQAAAKVVEYALSTAAWTLTDAFLTSFREGRATMQLRGAGDPTGRGFGYSFVRDVRSRVTDGDAGQARGGRTGRLQGTDADLRRMTTEQAKQKLIGFGLSEEEIEPLGRWVRIDLVRQLANASAADGTVRGIDKYVRHQKTTLLELQKRYRSRAQEIFERQISVLRDAAGEDLGDQEVLEAALEKELRAEEAGERREERRKRDQSPSPEDEAQQLEEMRAAGLLGSGPSQAKSKKAAASQAEQKEAAAMGIHGPLVPGQTRRIRRQVFMMTQSGEWHLEKELFYAGPDRPFLLASLYQTQSIEGTSAGVGAGGPWGFGTRTILPKKTSEASRLKRLGYAAARGRGGRRGRRGSGRGRGRGGRSTAVVASPTVAVAAAQRQSARERKIRGLDEDMAELGSDLESDFIDHGDEATFELETEATMQPKVASPRPAATKKPKKPKEKRPPRSPKQVPVAEVKKEPSPEFVYDFQLSDEEEEQEKGKKPEEEEEGDEYRPELEGELSDGGLLPDEVEEEEEELYGKRRKSVPRTGRARTGTTPVVVSASTGPVEFDPHMTYTIPAPQAATPVVETRQKQTKQATKRKKRRDSDTETDLSEEYVAELEEEEEDVYKPAKRVAKKPRSGSTGGSKKKQGDASLGKILCRILTDMKAEGDALKKKDPGATTYWQIFSRPVAKAYAPDYYTWVPEKRELWLEKVMQKAKRGAYPSKDTFLEDIKVIRNNAVEYNTKGHGQFGAEWIIAYADGMLQWVEERLKKEARNIAAVVGEATPSVTGGLAPPSSALPEFDPTAMYR